MELIKLNNKAELIKTLKQLAQHNKFQVRVLGNTRYKKEDLQDITKFISLFKCNGSNWIFDLVWSEV